MLINDGGTSKKKSKAKNVKIDSPSNPMQDKPETTPGKGNRGGKGSAGWTRTKYSKGKHFRDARPVPKKKKEEEKPSNNTGPAKKTRGGTKPRKDKAVRKIKSKRPKKNPPKPTKSTVKTEPSKTYNTTNLLAWDNQEQELLNAYISMAGTELFQYANAQTIDGAFNDVAIINVLSRRRQAYTPNRIIEQAQVYVREMWIENDQLCIEIEDPERIWDDCMLLFRVGISSTTIAETIN
jgi:hypothetical protein